MSPRLVTLLMIGLLILAIAGQSWAQITRTYSNAWSATTNQPSEQNFQIPNALRNSTTPGPGGQINKNFNNLWGSSAFGSGVEVQVTPTFLAPRGSTTFGPGGPGNR